MSITLAQICNAIETQLMTATGLSYTQSYNELKEGMNDWPMLQVYWDGSNQDPGGNADRSTFHAGVRQTDITVFADLYACPRRDIGEDMAALLPLVDAVVNVLEAQKNPNFGLLGIKGFNWSAQRVIFRYGETDFMGARFTIRIKVF